MIREWLRVFRLRGIVVEIFFLWDIAHCPWMFVTQHPMDI
jgi:hypothetical protein